jgi:transcription factor S
MAVEFCPNCGNLLRLGRSKEGKPMLLCKCGYIKEAAMEPKKKTFDEHAKKKLIKKTVILETTNQQTYPTTEIECPKCGNMTAEYFQEQTRSADEPATTFYRCIKCNHRWRKY